MKAKLTFPIAVIAAVLLITCFVFADAGEGLKVIFSEKAPAPIGPYSQAIKSGGQIFLSGQIGLQPATAKLISGGIKEETLQALKNLDEVLKAAGCSLADVVKCTVYLSNMNDFAAFNEVYSQYFSSWKPARETVGVAALPGGACIEISAVARIPK